MFASTEEFIQEYTVQFLLAHPVCSSASLRVACWGMSLYRLKKIQLETKIELIKRKDEDFEKSTIEKLDGLL